MDDMHIELITDIQRLREIASLWERISDTYVSMSPHWLSNWWDCYYEEKYSLRVYVAWENDALVVILPLMLIKDDETILRFMSNNCSDYLGVITNCNSTAHIDVILERILEDDEWDIIILDNIEAHDEITGYIGNKLIETNYEVTLRKHDDIARIILHKPWEIFISEKTHNVRHSYSSIWRKHNNQQVFDFRVLNEYDECIVNQMIDLHIKRWESIKHLSTFSDDRRRAFFHSIAKCFSENKKLIMFALFSEQTLVAYRFGFVVGNTYYDWNTSYNLEFEQFSCGRLLIRYVYDYCFNNSIKTIDFMKGLERYKEELMTNASYLYSIVCRRNRVILDYSPPKEKIKQIISKIRGVIFDLDGVVYSGKRPIEDTIKTITHLQKMNIRIGFLTNTSAKKVSTIQEKLESIGVKTYGCYFMTSAVAAGRYIQEIECKSCVVFGGDDALVEEINRGKVKTIIGKKEAICGVPSAIVIGYTIDFTYDDFVLCAKLIKNGASLICTDKDSKFAHDGGWLPGTGWIVSSLEYVTSQKAIVIGKPETTSLRYIIEEMQVDKNNLLMIGDNIDTDILAAKTMGIASCLLLGGISQKADVAKLSNRLKPDIIVNSLQDINNYFMEV